ncbi:hypothetical protein CEXT_495221 [Caerostris extrusa]|uniref:Uncharacterized protein n=1 Tax=Caerostris extrusa TaxID=172846 RepID=A0AAV4PF22_CAEEX|nr:hypothetical protein CEXT_495221 [Caerostris extrusa]
MQVINSVFPPYHPAIGGGKPPTDLRGLLLIDSGKPVSKMFQPFTRESFDKDRVEVRSFGMVKSQTGHHVPVLGKG